MKLTNRQLLGLPVATQSGQSVGQVVGFECDSEQHVILNYFVSASHLVSRLVGLREKTLIVARTQVISLNNERMIVHDSAVSETTPVVAIPFSSPTKAPTPATTSSLE